MKFVKTVYGCNRPQEYIKNWTNFETKVALKVGDLFAVDDDGKAIKAGKGKRPIGVVTESTTKKFGEGYQFTGERDENVLDVGSNVHSYRHFLVTGVELQEGEWDSAKIGDAVYFGDNGFSTTEAEDTYLVGTIERKMDKMVRFNLDLTIVRK